jgi:predicted O-linked N-acetylglucosamine transferase (SPINDLY family)
MNKAKHRIADQATMQEKPSSVGGAGHALQQQWLQQALQHHQQGQLAEAEALYRQVLSADQQQPDALNLLGVLALQVGHPAVAEELITQSLAIAPANIGAWGNLAKLYQSQKRFAEAEQAFHNAIQRGDTSAVTYLDLGSVCAAQGKHALALEHFSSAAAKGATVNPHAQLASVLKSLHRYEEAVHILKQALHTQPDALEILHDIANLLDRLGQYDEAMRYYEKAYIQASSASPSLEVHTILGTVHTKFGRFEESLEEHNKALAREPNNACLLSNLADAHRKLGHVDHAEKFYNLAIAAQPNFWEIYFNIGSFYKEQGALDNAIDAYLKAIAINPNFTRLWVYLAIAYGEKSDHPNAYAWLQKTLTAEPNNAEAHLAIGFLKKEQGLLSEALEHHTLAFAGKDNAAAHSNYLFMLHYDANMTPQDIYNKTLEWSARYAEGITHLPHRNNPNPDRRLRIGYVSADLYKHPVTAYIESMLHSHDAAAVEVFCYANQLKQDDVTKRIQSSVHQWRNIHGVSDDIAARLIQEDEIDILIDLSGHTASNRLLLFARKPAPIQATWIGYFNTTGMKAMDYIITDRFLVPPEDEHLYVEKPLRLPHSGAVYAVPDLEIPIKALPAQANGYITFGCFNALSKLTPEVIRVWSEILKRVPHAMLLLKNKSFGQESMCAQYSEHFAAHGITQERLAFAGASPTAAYLEAYNSVDIALDPFPYNGSTTTFDGFWMGVPIIALKGHNLVSHIGESLLSAVGLEELIGNTTEEYIEKAVGLAGNISKLSTIRNGLRDTLTAAPIANPPLFTRGLEAAFRNIWKQWCQTHTQL